MSAQATSFQRDIAPLFTAKQRECMIKARNFDLAKYEDVRDRAQRIYDLVSTQEMPLDEDPWPQDWVDLFGRWIAEGTPP